ncbi:uncharacterized protein [Cicer arietinum]|uniref:Uncharacterized protein LOC101503444 n=1 Tax=Cicer arietinum TaxID=3827 RepID=A0A1S2YS55_CICAR|nr:uncharacterized protein LOC101503444 [Cicer arietinum]
MESNSSSKSSYISQNTKKSKGSLKNENPFQSDYSWLHSVRKTPTKTWKKAPVAPMPPTPAKVYKVDPINFRELVQQLTCAPEFMPPQQTHDKLIIQSTDINVHSLPMKNLPSRDIVQVSKSQPLTVSTTNSNTKSWYENFQAEYFGKNSDQDDEVIMTPGLLEMNLFSPTSFGNWCFVPPIISPRI